MLSLKLGLAPRPEKSSINKDILGSTEKEYRVARTIITIVKNTSNNARRLCFFCSIVCNLE